MCVDFHVKVLDIQTRLVGDPFSCGIGPQVAPSSPEAVFHQLRIHSAQLRALAAPGALPEVPWWECYDW